MSRCWLPGNPDVCPSTFCNLSHFFLFFPYVKRWTTAPLFLAHGKFNIWQDRVSKICSKQSCRALADRNFAIFQIYLAVLSRMSTSSHIPLASICLTSRMLRNFSQVPGNPGSLSSYFGLCHSLLAPSRRRLVETGAEELRAPQLTSPLAGVWRGCEASWSRNPSLCCLDVSWQLSKIVRIESFFVCLDRLLLFTSTSSCLQSLIILLKS